MKTQKQLPTPPPQTELKSCRHPHLHFENGGQHLVCEDCGYAWVAVGLDPLRFMHDFAAVTMGLDKHDRRSDPFAQPKPFIEPVKTKN